MIWRLRVSYSSELYDTASADAMIAGSLADMDGGQPPDVGEGFGERVLEFPFHHRDAAASAARRLLAAGLPLCLEVETYQAEEGA